MLKSAAIIGVLLLIATYVRYYPSWTDIDAWWNSDE